MVILLSNLGIYSPNLWPSHNLTTFLNLYGKIMKKPAKSEHLALKHLLRWRVDACKA